MSDRGQTHVERQAQWTTIRWIGSGDRPTVRDDGSMLLVPVGAPVLDEADAFWLRVSAGPAPLTDEQVPAVAALVDVGAWASIADVPEGARGQVQELVDDGLLLPFVLGTGGFCRDDLVPVIAIGADEQLEVAGDPGDLLAMVDVRVPRGDGVATIPAVALRVLQAVDGERTAEAAVAQAMADLATEAGLERGPDEDPGLTELHDVARLALVLAAQAGLVVLDLR